MANGAPVFVKQLAGGEGEHYLYRNSKGNWLATDEESDGRWGEHTPSVIMSSGRADLPTDARLRGNWKYSGDDDWIVDPELSCTLSLKKGCWGSMYDDCTR